MSADLEDADFGKDNTENHKENVRPLSIREVEIRETTWNLEQWKIDAAATNLEGRFHDLLIL